MHPRTMPGLVVLLALGACHERGRGPLSPPRELEGGAEIAIRNGPDVGMYLKVRPPHAAGPFSNMVIRKGRISGIHCGGGFDVTARPDRISGFGPGGGVVEMELWGDDSELHAEGLWNGSYGHVDATPESLRVTLALRPTRVERGRVIPAIHRSWAFQRGADGLFTVTGALNPGGTPRSTSLSIDARVTAYLTRPEILTLLMTMLAGGIDRGIGDPFACGARG